MKNKHCGIDTAERDGVRSELVRDVDHIHHNGGEDEAGAVDDIPLESNPKVLGESQWEAKVWILRFEEW